jgi:ribonuclease R
MSKKKKLKHRIKSAGINKKALKNSILGIFTQESSKPLNYKQIARQLLVKDSSTRKLINEVLAEMAREETLEETQRGKFRLKAQTGYIIGRVDLTNAGYGFIISDDIEEDVFVSQRNLNHSLDGDLVKVYLMAKRKGRQPEGEVVEIIERKRIDFVGTIEMNGPYIFMIPDNRKTPFDMFIPSDGLNGAKNGQKVIARITDWPKRAKNPFGEVVDILGDPGENNAEIHSILAEFELPYDFPVELEEEASNISLTIPEEEYKTRRDFRSIPTFTIDPEDAKDFDDALSVKKKGNGNWEVGIHIADVTHYVKPKSNIDDEAQGRATSVYLVDRVVPMLPEILSNQVCSLRPNEEKLCFSAVFEITQDAQVVDQWFGRTVIYSDRRFTYEEAQEVLDTKTGDMSTELVTLNQIARQLRAERFQQGSYNFERDEVKFELDDKGRPLGIKFKQHGESNELIEEFMLLANRKVANFIGNVEGRSKTFVYRIHDKPDPEKLTSFNSFIHRFGYKVNVSNEKQLSQTMNKLLDQVKGKKEQNVIETLAIRTMAKASYSTKNIGHYGLGFSYYTHFTSPIRRFPDMMVHRLLAHYLDGGKSKNKDQHEKMCLHASEMERLAEQAERASIKYKQVEFMMDKVGKEYEGIISGVTDWGLFVELVDNKCEGLVAMRDLTDDFYEYDEDNYCITGRHTGRVLQLGDPVKIEILRANLAKKQLDFALVDEETEEN